MLHHLKGLLKLVAESCNAAANEMPGSRVAVFMQCGVPGLIKVHR